MKKFLVLACTIFVASCARNTQSSINVCRPCTIIYGHENDWNVISDDLARNIYRNNILCENN